MTDHRPPRVERIMGTAVLFDVRDHWFDVRTVDRTVASLREIEAVFSTYQPDSEISRLRSGRLSLGDADPVVREVLDRCDRIRRETDGAFDHRSGSELDPSGYVKGWAIEGAARTMSDAGTEAFLISAGGDIVARGAPPGSEAWTVAIRDPEDTDAVLGTVTLNDSAIATSGRYERGEHIWETVDDAVALTSVSVLGPDLGIADAVATAILAGGLSGATWLNRFAGYDFVAVTADRRILRSPTARFTPATAQ